MGASWWLAHYPFVGVSHSLVRLGRVDYSFLLAHSEFVGISLVLIRVRLGGLFWPFAKTTSTLQLSAAPLGRPIFNQAVSAFFQPLVLTAFAGDAPNMTNICLIQNSLLVRMLSATRFEVF